MPTITLSADTYAKLERLARPFRDGSEEDVIRRLAEAALASPSTYPAPTPGAPPSSARPLVSNKGSLPHGTILKSWYKGTEYVAEVRDGKVWCNGHSYSTLSAAAVAVIQSTGSKRNTENGWRFWQRVGLQRGTSLPSAT
jgi:hypothetical protein